MIDIHSHVVWGVDDGARSREDSIAMLKLAAETGTTDIVATPHCSPRYKFDAPLRNARIQELMEATGASPRIHPGCDFHLSFQNIESALREPGSFTINGLRYLMVEFDDVMIPPATEEVFRRFMDRDVCPVITHPERNPVLQKSLERLRRWTQMGCLLQITAQSLTDRFGKRAHAAAWEFLREGLVHVIASDGHDLNDRPPRLDVAREILTRELSAEAADLLLLTNPAAIIAGETVSLAAPAAGKVRRQRWFSFRR